MIRSLRLENFKNFAKETLHVGPFTIIVGINAAGKSNIRDAFRFLHGISRGYGLAELIGGKYEDGIQIWAPIRGRIGDLFRSGNSSFRLDLEFYLDEKITHYRIRIGHGKRNTQEALFVMKESLHVGNEIIYTSHPPSNPSSSENSILWQDGEVRIFLHMAKSGRQSKYENKISVSASMPALTQILNSRNRNVTRKHREQAALVCESLKLMRFLELIPHRMRLPAFPGNRTLGDGGENLPTVLEDICAKEHTRVQFLEWLRELTSMDIHGFEFPRDPSGLVHLIIRENNQQHVSALSTSDGTLRFLALLAIMLGDYPMHCFFFEGIDNGIHPSRLKLLLDLVEGQTQERGMQVITTTHSADLLATISDATFKSTSVVARPSRTSAAIIRLISELPRASELRTSQGLGRLLASGWLEDALVFTEALENDESD